MGASDGMVGYLHGHASTIVRRGVQPCRHWRQYDSLVYSFPYSFFLEKRSDSQVTGTLAAVFQSVAYGGFTPAGGIFATLTSMAMLGRLMPMQVSLAALVAAVVSLVVWACGVGP